jgi:hypothetical protein
MSLVRCALAADHDPEVLSWRDRDPCDTGRGSERVTREVLRPAGDANRRLLDRSTGGSLVMDVGTALDGGRVVVAAIPAGSAGGASVDGRLRGVGSLDPPEEGSRLCCGVDLFRDVLLPLPLLVLRMGTTLLLALLHVTCLEYTSSCSENRTSDDLGGVVDVEL